MASHVIIQFQERRDHFEKESLTYSKLSDRISFARTGVFITCLIMAFIWMKQSAFTPFMITLLLLIVLFGSLVNYHNRTKYKSRHQKFLSGINQDEISRNERNFNGFDPGSEFIDHDHPYIVDLDIFGKHSLYQLLNRATADTGKKKLAHWLSFPAEISELQLRRESVKELSGKIDFRQEFQAIGLHEKSMTDSSSFLSWLNSKNLLAGKKFYRFVSFVNPAILAILLVLYLFSMISFDWLIMMLILNSLIILSVLGRVGNIHIRTSASIQVLKAVGARIRLMEGMKFNCGKLKNIQSSFYHNGEKGSSAIGRLKRILMNLDNRRNFFYQLINVALLLDIHISIQAEIWKSEQSGHIPAWFDSLDETEALISLAGFAFSNPGYVFPKFMNSECHFEAEELGHPLIPEGERINNDFTIKGRGIIALITGSNMGGKTTFLRTIGVNTVLALAGAPVCAGRLVLSPVSIYTSMRTQDALSENVSSFYAELKRIGQLLKRVNENKNVLFLLDEILKGTNSKDRHLGAVSLVKQLSELGASGLISTHDLELARNALNPENMINYGFESTIRGDEIFFDYKLRKGLCESMNASKLMEKMGIRLIKK